MWTTIGCLLLFGDMVCVIARLIHGSTGFLTPLFFLVAAAGLVMLAIGRKKKGAFSSRRRISKPA